MSLIGCWSIMYILKSVFVLQPNVEAERKRIEAKNPTPKKPLVNLVFWVFIEKVWIININKIFIIWFYISCYLTSACIFRYLSIYLSIYICILKCSINMIFWTRNVCYYMKTRNHLFQVINVEGTWRVGGLLALSRAFGDAYLKEYNS